MRKIDNACKKGELIIKRTLVLLQWDQEESNPHPSVWSRQVYH